MHRVGRLLNLALNSPLNPNTFSNKDYIASNNFLDKEAFVTIQEVFYDSHEETPDASMADTPSRPPAASNEHPVKVNNSSLMQLEVSHNGTVAAICPAPAPCGISCINFRN